MLETHAPPLPLSVRGLVAELIAVKRKLDLMDAEDREREYERPWLGDWLLFPTPEARAAEIERWHGVTTKRRRKLNFRR